MLDRELVLVRKLVQELVRGLVRGLVRIQVLVLGQDWVQRREQVLALLVL